MRQHKPKLEGTRIPYAVVSVDKLIEIAERLVILERKVKNLESEVNTIDDQIITAIVPHISDFRDGKIFIRAQGENGTIYRAEIQVIGEIEEDRQS